MSAFTAAELAAMQTAQEAHMMDSCVIQRFATGDGDDYGPGGPPAYTDDDAAIACGFKPASVREIMDGTQVAMTAAQIRLPISTVLDNRDRIKVTKRFGVTLTPAEIYRIVGHPKRGPSGLIVQADSVTDSNVLER